MAYAPSVFISAVSREFGRAREQVANALRKKALVARVQSSFALTDGTTLAQLHEIIRECDRVLAVLGSYSGAFPPDGAVTPEFRAMLPEGMDRASYTVLSLVQCLIDQERSPDEIVRTIAELMIESPFQPRRTMAAYFRRCGC